MTEITNLLDGSLGITQPYSYGWNHPAPLTPSFAPDIPYPVDALPSCLQQAVITYQQYGQQPIPLVACSALANLSLACQTLANIARDRYLVSPVSLYFLVVASSGERKSAVDNVFSKVVRDWEFNFRQKREKEVQSAITLHHAWQMERDGMLSQIKRCAFTGEDADYLKMLLTELIEDEPEIPLLPTLYFEDATQEALAVHLANGWPSASLWSDEAGIVLGSHSMQSNPTRFVALLNRLWDGKSLTAHRKTTQSFMIKNRRLTLNLMMQPRLLHNMGTPGADISRQSGFMARCLLAYPESSMGKRFYQEPPTTLDCMAGYEKRLHDCLNQSKHLSQTGCVQLATLWMNPVAKQCWIQFFNHIEAGLISHGQWINIKDFASKASENVARLAALFHLFEGKAGDISVEHVEQAIEIIRWHLQETRRLLTLESISGNSLADAQKLLHWLLDKGLETLTLRDIQRLSPLRDKKQRDEAIERLIENHLARLLKENGKTFLELNPCLF